MTNRTHSLRHAGSAIAAALAIASTPSLAQDVAAPFPAAPAPVIVVPDIPPPTAPAPVIVLPAEQPPTVQPVPETSAETPEPQPTPSSVAKATRTSTAAPAPRAVAEPAARTASPAVAASEPAALPPVTTAQPVAVEPVAPPATAEPTRTAANDNTGLVALALGAFAFLALAIWGFVAIGRRKPIRRYAAQQVAPNAVPMAPTPVVSETAQVREPMAVVPRGESGLSGPAFAPRPAVVSGALPPAGASVALPARAPQDYAERDALMKRMIAAKPDRANPFTDRGARTKRARLILQSLGRDFGETEPWIDLSQYPNNWPELARKRSAAA
jgi:hypothetical protein